MAIAAVGTKVPQKPLFSNGMLRRLLIPLVIEQALAVAVGVVDTMMVSSVGEAAVSGVSLVDLITLLIINIFAALATGGAVVISQYIGAKQPEKANECASQLSLLSMLIGALVAVFVICFAPLIMANLFGTLADDVYQAGLLYLQISAISFPFLALYNAGAAIFRSTGNSKISMQVSLVMNIINIAGNALCIFVLKMGVAGVAIPSVISRAVACGMILYLCSKPNQAIRVKLKLYINPVLSGRILKIGIPSAFENSLFQAGRIMVVGMIATFGTTQITAQSVANNIDSIGCMPGLAFSLGMITVVGRCIGAGDQEQAVYYTKKIMLWIYVIGGITNLTVFICMPFILNLYVLSDATRQIAQILISIHLCSGILIWPSAFVLPNALRAASDIRYTMYVSIISMWVCRLGIGYLLCIHFGYGAIGIWVAMIVDWIVRAIFFIARCLSGKWKGKYIPDTKPKGATAK